MEDRENENEGFNHEQSLQVIREMIEITRRKLQNDGILFIIWGCALFYSAMSRFLISRFLFSHMEIETFKVVGFIVSVFTVCYTLVVLWTQRKKTKTYIGISLRWVWISVIFCMILINLIQGNILHEINFGLQHPIFMVVFAYAVIVTGVILWYRLMIIMGIVFGILAWVSSFFELHVQLLFEATAWLCSFIIPGVILLARKLSGE
jgi:hypothetical protein